MLHHVGVSAEGVVANGAFDRLPARVHVVMFHQLLSRYKPLLAYVTSVK